MKAKIVINPKGRRKAVEVGFDEITVDGSGKERLVFNLVNEAGDVASVEVDRKYLRKVLDWKLLLGL